MKLGIELLLQKRTAVGFSPTNPYFFCVLNGSSDSSLRGCTVLRELSEQCGACRPEAIRATKLRKQVATTSQLLHFDDNEMDVLAWYWGHDIKVHREFYRMPDALLQVAKVSKYLCTVQKGELSKYQGKKLSDIQVNEDDLKGKMLSYDIYFVLFNFMTDGDIF